MALTEMHLAASGAPKERRRELELREAELREPRGRWPVGRRGVIVDAFATEATLEITDDEGRTLDLLCVPYGAISILPARDQERLSV